MEIVTELQQATMKGLFQRHTFQKVIAQTTMFEVAIGLAIAGVFIKLINAFVTYILTPPIGALIGGKSLANFDLALSFLPGKEPVLFRYGMFLDTLVEFLLVALIVYWIARLVLRIKKKGAEMLNHKIACSECAMEIPRAAKKCPYCHFIVKGS